MHELRAPVQGPARRGRASGAVGRPYGARPGARFRLAPRAAEGHHDARGGARRHAQAGQCVPPYPGDHRRARALFSWPDRRVSPTSRLAPKASRGCPRCARRRRWACHPRAPRRASPPSVTRGSTGARPPSRRPGRSWRPPSSTRPRRPRFRESRRHPPPASASRPRGSRLRRRHPSFRHRPTRSDAQRCRASTATVSIRETRSPTRRTIPLSPPGAGWGAGLSPASFFWASESSGTRSRNPTS